MASVKSYLKPFRPILIMIFLLLVGFLTYITATDEPDDSVNDFAEFETEGDEDEEEDTEPQGANDQDDEDEGLFAHCDRVFVDKRLQIDLSMALKFNEATSIKSMILSEWPTLIFEEICREGLQDFDMNRIHQT